VLLKRKVGGSEAEETIVETSSTELELYLYRKRNLVPQAVKVLNAEPA
jgi:hypothetical protein